MKEDKFRIKPFKEDIKSVWYGFRHYKIINEDIVLVAGGSPCEESYSKVKSYFKRKKLI